MVKFIVVGDMHFRLSSPRCRKDNIFETQKAKFDQIVQYAIDNGIKTVLQTGDMFDTPTPPRELLTEVVRLFYSSRSKGIVWVSVFGGHDLYMRSYKAINRSPLKLLEEAGLVVIVSSEMEVSFPGMVIAGRGVGEPILAPSKTGGVCLGGNIREFYILLTHEMPFFPRSDRFYDSFSMIKPVSLSKQERKSLEKYNLVVAGDWHFPVYGFDKPCLLNPGAMTRLKISDEVGLREPEFCVVMLEGTSLEEANISRIKLKTGEWDVVFEEKDSLTERKTEIEPGFGAFLNKLKDTANIQEGISFIEAVRNWIEKEPNEELRQIVEEALAYAEIKEPAN